MNTVPPSIFSSDFLIDVSFIVPANIWFYLEHLQPSSHQVWRHGFTTPCERTVKVVDMPDHMCQLCCLLTLSFMLREHDPSVFLFRFPPYTSYTRTCVLGLASGIHEVFFFRLVIQHNFRLRFLAMTSGHS